MADTRKPPETPGGGPRRKRAAPTIDLKATEVGDPHAEKREAAAPGLKPGTPPEPTQGAGKPSTFPTPDSPGPGAERGRSAVASEPAVEEPTKAEPERERATPPPPPPPPPRRGGFGAGFAGGVIGALIVALLGVGLWYGGFIPTSTEPSDLPARLAALDKQVQALQNQPAPRLNTEALNASIGAVNQRVSKLESELGNLPPNDKAAAQRFGTLDSTVKSLSDTVTALGKRVDDIAAAANQAQQSAAAAGKSVNDLRQSVQSAAKGETSVTTAALDSLQSKIASLEAELASTRNKIEDEIRSMRGDVTSAQERIARTTASDRAARLALSAAALRNAVVSGAPYGAELAQALSLGADARALAPLKTFAAKGVPTKKALADELSRLIPAMREAAGVQQARGGILERLQANAQKLVRITPVEAPAGNDPRDVLARIEAGAERGDIENALAELARLPDKVRAPAEDWIAKAKARQAALAAARSFVAGAARALSKG